MTITPIYKIQGAGAESPYAQQMVVTEGVVTGWGRRGFFIQETQVEHYQSPDARGCSQAIFVFYKGKMPPTGTQLRLKAKVVDYVKSPEQFDKPVTQLHFEEVELVERDVPLPEPIVLNWATLVANRQSLASFLNAHESMLFRIEAGAEFLQASNSFGDYVVLPADAVNKPSAIADYLPTALRGAWTHARLPGSPAINTGDPSIMIGEDGLQRFDQRGAPYSRIHGGLIDMGAVESRSIGDSNGDGVFDSSDLIRVFQAGKYEDDVDNNANFDEGDWNGDGDFDSSDMIAAFQSASYNRRLAATVPEPRATSGLLLALLSLFRTSRRWSGKSGLENVTDSVDR